VSKIILIVKSINNTEKPLEAHVGEIDRDDLDDAVKEMTDSKYLGRTWSSDDADDLKNAAEDKGAYFMDEAENDSDSYNIVTRHSDYLEDGDDEVTVVINYTCGDDRSIDVATARTVATFDGETRDLLFDYMASL
jgi:hypothetical protein